MDMGASVIARLKNKAKETGKPFQLHLQLFCQEEFLRRLAASCYAENLVLKGGLFIYTLTNFESRATVDIDFLLQTIQLFHLFHHFHPMHWPFLQTSIEKPQIN